VYERHDWAATQQNDFALTGAATAHEALDDNAPDDDTTYAESSTVGHKIRVNGHSALPAAASTVTFLAAVGRSNKQSGPARSAGYGGKSGATESTPTARPISVTTYLWAGECLGLNPATSAPFTPAQVNALEALHTVAA
jgi:hypothetical protein